MIPLNASPRYRFNTFDPRDGSMWNHVKRSSPGTWKHQLHKPRPRSGCPVSSIPIYSCSRQGVLQFLVEGPKASAHFRTAFITCPWLIGNRNTSARNLRIVSTDMWQAPF